MQAEHHQHAYRWYADPVCIGAQIAFLGNSVLLQFFVLPDFLSWYFNDLLLIPAALPPVLALQRSLGTRKTGFEAPSITDVLWHLALWSVLFEWFGPRFLHTGTSDILDILAYSTGALFALYFWHTHRERYERTGQEKISRSTRCPAGGKPAAAR